MDYIHHIFTRTFRRVLVFLMLLALPQIVFADEITGNVSNADSAAMARTKENAITLQETDSTGPNYMGYRRALVGRHCSVNRVISAVSVGSGTSGLENITNEDIDDYATIPSVVDATVAVSPTVSVRDMKYYYAPGTTAGFCLVAGSGGSVLSLDLIKTFHLWFYCDGKRVADQTVQEANAASGVKLSLIGIPGSNMACVNLTARCPKKFDEVALVQGGAVDASVASALLIKYAFVGDAHDIHLTKKGIEDYCQETGHESMDVSCNAYMPSPLVGGIPIPMANVSEEKVIGTDTNERLDETLALVSAVQLASVAFKGRVRVNVQNSQATTELFHPGDQVGFKYNFANVADVLELGTWVDIALYDRNGNKVQTTTISADVLELAIASGGDQTSYITAETDFSGAEITFYSALGVLDIGSGYGVYYGFIRPKPVVDHACELNPTVSTNICNNQSTFQLRINPEMNVTWSVYSQPAGANAQVDENGFVTGMTVDGKYVFRVTAEDGICMDSVVINRGAEPDFRSVVKETTLTASNGYEMGMEYHQTSANLISISDMHGSDGYSDGTELLDDDLTNYIGYDGGLQLAGANRIIGVKKTEGKMYDGGKVDAHDPIRVGFVVELEQNNLGLSLLDFFQIRCYNNGTNVYEHLVEDANVLDLGTIGSNPSNRKKSTKMRLDIEVPRIDGNGNAIVFDEIQLWKDGVLNLSLDELNIYYAFMDDPNDPDCNYVRDGATVVNYDNYGARVTIGTEVNVASVGCVTNNLSNIIDIDDNLETYALVQKTVNAGSQRIIVKLGRTVDFRHKLGVVIDNDVNALNVELGEVLEIATYLNGVATGETENDWEVLGTDLVSGGGLLVLQIQPKSDFDEVHIIAAGGLSADQTLKIYGILLRNDIDNDGIPDNRDESTCSEYAFNTPQFNKTCEGGTLTFTCNTNPDTRFYIEVPDQGVNMTQVQSAQNGSLTMSFPAIKSGRYSLFIYDGEQELVGTESYVVYPLQTTWRTTTTNKDWNNWNNWTDGTPYLCTNVIMPSNARAYPSLDKSVVQGDEFGCDGIHFESGAAVEKVFKLNYDSAWVDFKPETGRYYMLATPLKDTYTGDFYVTAVSSDTLTEYNYFKPAASSTLQPENRFEPRIYQRLWAQTATNKLTDGTYQTAELLETNWSKRFNALATPYTLGQGFSLYVDSEGREGDMTLRLPKTHTTYHYYYEANREQSSLTETLTRTNPHRFVYEADGYAPSTLLNKDFGEFGTRSVYSNAGTMTMSSATASAATTTLLVGNPFMSYLSVNKLLEANPSLTGVKVYDGQSVSSTVSIDGTLLSNADAATTYIAPMQSFYVTVSSAATSVNITFTEDMFVHAEAEESSNTPALIRVTAKSRRAKASTLLLSDEMRAAETLVDEEAKPALAIFSIDEGKACDIASLVGKDIIPLGMMVTGQADTLTVAFDALGDVPGDYRLLDRETGMVYAQGEEAVVELAGSTLGRFALVKPSVLTAINNIDMAECIKIEGNTATVCIPGANLLSATAYTVDGKYIDKQHAETNNANGQTLSVKVRLASGVNIIRVKANNGEERSYKVLAK